MKQFFYICLLAMTLPGGFSASARTLSRGETNLRKDEALKVSGNHLIMQNVPELKLGTVERAASARSVDVDFYLLNTDDYIIKFAVAIDNETGECVYYADNTTWGPASIPTGKYTFLFWGECNEEPYYRCICADEDVVIDEAREYAVDFSRCTEMVEFQSLLPDGSRGQFKLENFDTNEVLEEGTIAAGWWNLYVFVGDTLIDFTSGRMERGMYDDGWSFNEEDAGNTLVNPGIKNISFVQYRELIGAEGKNGIYYTSIVANPAKGGVYTNDIADYACLHNPISITLDAQEVDWENPVLYDRICYDGTQISMASFSNMVVSWPKAEDYWLGSNREAEKLGLSFYPSPAVVATTGYAYTVNNDDLLGIIGCPLANVDGKIEVLAYPTTLDGISNLNTYNMYSSWMGYRCWIENPWFTTQQDKRKIIDGNSVPILVAEPLWYSSEVGMEFGLRNVLYHNYRGRNGESRTIDFVNEAVTVKVNGEVQDLFSQVPTINSMRLAPDQRYGDWEIELVNNNIVVNGEKGLNTTIIRFNDEGSDVCAPTLQMLQTVNADGDVTDVFTSALSGRVILAGGDFNAMYSEPTGNEWFDVEDCDIKLEWAVAGDEDWHLLECEENRDRFMMPGWGYYWEASLASIPAPSVETKYALRITLEDMAGNTQQQTLSPVFTILASASGVDKVSAFSSVSGYYNLQGIKVAEPKDGEICIERKSDGTFRKVQVKY